MDFNTDSVWYIVYILILVTIFIVVWYLYNEIISCKVSIKNISNELHKDHDLVSYQLEPLDSDPQVVHDQEPLDSDPQVVHDQEPLDSDPHGFHDQEPLDSDPHGFHDQEPLDSDPHGFHDHMKCNFVLLSGKRKGEPCNIKVSQDGLCKKHNK